MSLQLDLDKVSFLKGALKAATGGVFWVPVAHLVFAFDFALDSDSALPLGLDFEADSVFFTTFFAFCR